MPRRPADDERAEYRRDRAQRFARAILLMLLQLGSSTADVLRTSLYIGTIHGQLFDGPLV